MASVDPVVTYPHRPAGARSRSATAETTCCSTSFVWVRPRPYSCGSPMLFSNCPVSSSDSAGNDRSVAPGNPISYRRLAFRSAVRAATKTVGSTRSRLSMTGTGRSSAQPHQAVVVEPPHVQVQLLEPGQDVGLLRFGAQLVGERVRPRVQALGPGGDEGQRRP